MEQETNPIKWPGPWLDEELTDQESADCVTLAYIISEIKQQGPFQKYPQNEKDPTVITPEYAAVWERIAPYLNSFMHLVYKMKNLPDWTKKDPVGAVSSLIDFIFDDKESLAELPGQTTIPEMQEPSIDEVIKRASKKAKPELFHLTGYVPERYMWPVDKVTAKMVGLQIDGIVNETRVIKENKRQPAIYTKFFLSYGSDELSENLPAIYGGTWTQRDREVESAYFTLYENGVDVFTPEMLFRTLYGRADSEKPTPQQTGAMTRTIEKHRNLRTMIDCRDEFERRGYSTDKAYLRDPPLMVSEIVVEAGGRVKRAYRFVTQPIRLGYIKKLRQIVDVPRELLDIKELDKRGHITARSKSLTEQRLFVRNELLRRIEGIKNPNNKLRQKTIALESYADSEGHHRGLYEIAGYTDPTKQQAEKIRSFARDALAFWKASGYIKGYSFEKKGKTISRIRIDP